MATNPVDLGLWVTRLRSQLSTVQAVEVARSTSANLVERFGKVAPAVYVVRHQGNARRDGDAAGSTVQWVEVFVEVVLVARKYADPLASGGLSDLDALRALVWGALIGWRPADCALPIELDRYTDGDPSNAVVYGIDRFATAHQITA